MPPGKQVKCNRRGSFMNRKSTKKAMLGVLAVSMASASLGSFAPAAFAATEKQPNTIESESLSYGFGTWSNNHGTYLEGIKESSYAAFMYENADVKNLASIELDITDIPSVNTEIKFYAGLSKSKDMNEGIFKSEIKNGVTNYAEFAEGKTKPLTDENGMDINNKTPFATVKVTKVDTTKKEYSATVTYSDKSSASATMTGEKIVFAVPSGVADTVNSTVEANGTNSLLMYVTVPDDGNSKTTSWGGNYDKMVLSYTTPTAKVSVGYYDYEKKNSYLQLDGGTKYEGSSRVQNNDVLYLGKHALQNLGRIYIDCLVYGGKNTDGSYKTSKSLAFTVYAVDSKIEPADSKQIDGNGYNLTLKDYKFDSADAIANYSKKAVTESISMPVSTAKTEDKHVYVKFTSVDTFSHLYTFNMKYYADDVNTEANILNAKYLVNNFAVDNTQVMVNGSFNDSYLGTVENKINAINKYHNALTDEQKADPANASYIAKYNELIGKYDALKVVKAIDEIKGYGDKEAEALTEAEREKIKVVYNQYLALPSTLSMAYVGMFNYTTLSNLVDKVNAVYGPIITRAKDIYESIYDFGEGKSKLTEDNYLAFSSDVYEAKKYPDVYNTYDTDKKAVLKDLFGEDTPEGINEKVMGTVSADSKYGSRINEFEQATADEFNGIYAEVKAAYDAADTIEGKLNAVAPLRVLFDNIEGSVYNEGTDEAPNYVPVFRDEISDKIGANYEEYKTMVSGVVSYGYALELDEMVTALKAAIIANNGVSADTYNKLADDYYACMAKREQYEASNPDITSFPEELQTAVKEAIEYLGKVESAFTAAEGNLTKDARTKIDKLGIVEFTVNSIKAVQDARAAYNKLSETLKGYVNDPVKNGTGYAYIDKLEAKEAELEALRPEYEAAVEQMAIDAATYSDTVSAILPIDFMTGYVNDGISEENPAGEKRDITALYNSITNDYTAYSNTNKIIKQYGGKDDTSFTGVITPMYNSYKGIYETIVGTSKVKGIRTTGWELSEAYNKAFALFGMDADDINSSSEEELYNCVAEKYNAQKTALDNIHIENYTVKENNKDVAKEGLKTINNKAIAAYNAQAAKIEGAQQFDVQALLDHMADEGITDAQPYVTPAQDEAYVKLMAAISEYTGDLDDADSRVKLIASAIHEVFNEVTGEGEAWLGDYASYKAEYDRLLAADVKNSEENAYYRAKFDASEAKGELAILGVFMDNGLEASAVVSAIDAVGTVDITDECSEAITAAEEAYAAVKDVAKKLVDSYYGIENKPQVMRNEYNRLVRISEWEDAVMAIPEITSSAIAKTYTDKVEKLANKLVEEDEEGNANPSYDNEIAEGASDDAKAALAARQAELEIAAPAAAFDQKVLDVSNAIAEGSVTSEACKELNDMFNALQKDHLESVKMVTQYAAYLNCMSYWNGIEALEFKNKAEALTELGTYTYLKKNEYDNLLKLAEDAYNALNEDQKKYNYAVSGLEILSQAKDYHSMIVAGNAEINNVYKLLEAFITTINTEGYVYDTATEQYNAAEAAIKALKENKQVDGKNKTLFSYVADSVTYVVYTTAADKYTSQRAVKEVEALISEIGVVEGTAESNTKIQAARNAYEALTDEQKSAVSNYSVLETAEKVFKSLVPEADITKAKEDAKKVVDLIAALDDTNVTEESRASINAARAAYNKLSELAKTYVSNYSKLAACEKALPVTLKGDVNKDGKVNASDLKIVMRAILHTSTADDGQYLANCDVDGSGTVNILDALAVIDNM